MLPVVWSVSSLLRLTIWPNIVRGMRCISSRRNNGTGKFILLFSPKVKHIDLDVAFDWPFNQSTIGKLLKYPFRYHKFRKRFTRLLMEIRPDITLSTIRREVKFIHSIADGSKKVGEFHVTRYSYGVGKGGFFGNMMQKRWDNELQGNLRKLDQFVVLTHEEAAFWPELNNIRVIPNPIITQTERFSECTSHQVIAVGRYAPQKGFDLLIEAWNIMLKNTRRGNYALRGWFVKRFFPAKN